ncbi:MAG: signal peptidase II [Chloroflexi bacterium]|nr:signal peptidase II [Chloroflexota bacterium]
MTTRSTRLIPLLSVLLVTIAADQLAKVAARQYLASQPPISLLGGIVRLQYTENLGAFLGLGAWLPAELRFWAFTVVAGAVLLGILVYLLWASSLSLPNVVALALIVAGGLGNQIDRFLQEGRVTDFMVLGLGPLHTGIFNLADVAVMAGIALLLLDTARGEQETTVQPDSAG